MTTEWILPVVIAVIGSGAVFGFIQFLINRKDKKSESKSETLAEIKKLNGTITSLDARIDKLEKDGCRTQLILMIAKYPKKTDEIMRLAEYYFDVLHGDWYMTSMFAEWLRENDIIFPGWFNEHHK